MVTRWGMALAPEGIPLARHVQPRRDVDAAAGSQCQDVGEACSLFDPLLETLTAREQARILHLLIKGVDYDGPNGTVSITFHPTGIKTLADELSQQEVTV